eukprot:7531563-Lingulodinium_polyedra.AAC.1
MEEGTPLEPGPTDYIPVPDSSPHGGGPPSEDHWVRFPGFWARIHVQPRRAAFVPEGVVAGGAQR